MPYSFKHIIGRKTTDITNNVILSGKVFRNTLGFGELGEWKIKTSSTKIKVYDYKIIDGEIEIWWEQIKPTYAGNSKFGETYSSKPLLIASLIVEASRSKYNVDERFDEIFLVDEFGKYGKFTPKELYIKHPTRSLAKYSALLNSMVRARLTSQVLFTYTLYNFMRHFTYYGLLGNTRAFRAWTNRTMPGFYSGNQTSNNKTMNYLSPGSSSIIEFIEKICFLSSCFCYIDYYGQSRYHQTSRSSPVIAPSNKKSLLFNLSAPNVQSYIELPTINTNFPLENNPIYLPREIKHVANSLPLINVKSENMIKFEQVNDGIDRIYNSLHINFKLGALNLGSNVRVKQSITRYGEISKKLDPEVAQMFQWKTIVGSTNSPRIQMLDFLFGYKTVPAMPSGYLTVSSIVQGGVIFEIQPAGELGLSNLFASYTTAPVSSLIRHAYPRKEYKLIALIEQLLPIENLKLGNFIKIDKISYEILNVSWNHDETVELKIRDYIT